MPDELPSDADDRTEAAVGAGRSSIGASVVAGGGSSTAERAGSVAEVVAATLRSEILSGRLPEGALLPPLDELLKQFGASKPSIRQGLRILESEGLLSVRRGRHGGAVVHRPASSITTYTMELLFRAEDISADDMSEALREIEPVCAGMCARREDRHEVVVPALRAVQSEGEAAVGDVAAWSTASRRFHEEMVRLCGNATVSLLMGAVESVCSVRAAAWARQAPVRADLPIHDDAYRHRGLEDHALILKFIERGDWESATREARLHLHWVPTYPNRYLVDPDGRPDAD